MSVTRLSTGSTSWRRVLIIGVALVALLVAFRVTIVVAPRAIVWYDLHGRISSPQDQVKALNGARVATLQAITGLALVVGTYGTWRRLGINEEELRVTRDGQVTERFGRSIDQLGLDKLDVRLGGIYGLERIARNSASDRDSIVA